MVNIIALSRGKERNVRTIEATFSRDGELIPLKVIEDDRPQVFNEINKLLEQKDLDIENAARELFNLMSPEAKVQEQINSSYYLSSSLSIRDGHIFFGDNRLEETLATHMMSLLDEENTPKDEKMWRSYVKFLDNLHQNANEDIRKQLFRWMEYENKAGNGFGITEDGCLVGYKGCGGTILEPMSKFTGFAIVDGEEYNGHIPNRVGSVIQMPRSAVQNDPSVGCSVGLHVGTRDYAVKWAPILLLVKVNPRDVVSVPYECDSQKMRVCEYTVLKVTDASEEHKMFYADETDYNEDFDALSSGEAYDLLGHEIYVEYDGSESSAEGKLIDVYDEGETNIIIETEDGEYVDIELARVNYYEVLDDECDDCDGCDCDGFDCDEDCDEDFCTEDDFDEQEMTLEDAYELLNRGDEIYVNYDGKSHEGVVVEVYEAQFKDPGVIVKNNEGQYKHIKLYRIEDWGILEDEDNKEEIDNPQPQNPFEGTHLGEAIDTVFKVLNEVSKLGDSPGCKDNENCDNCDTMGVYKGIYELPLGTKVIIVYNDKNAELQGLKTLKVFAGEVGGINKCDMEIILVNDTEGQVTINFTDIVSVQEV